ncbi:formyl transferase [Shimia sp. W99]
MKLLVMASPGDSTNILVNRLIDDGFRDIHVFEEPPQSRWVLLRGRVRRVGWRMVIGQVLFMALVQPLLRRSAGARLQGIQEAYGLRTTRLSAASITRITSVNSSEAQELLRCLAPDVVVLSGTRIVKRETLVAADAPVLNIHAGITPEYRGVHGGYWALWMGRPEEFGATLHLVDAGVDSGAVLSHVRPVPTAQDNFATYPLLQLGAALPALVNTLTKLDQRKTLPDPVPTTGAGRQWFHPTLWQYLIGLRRGVR